jgi:hypothetical protein
MELQPCSGRPRAYEGAWRCLGFTLLPSLLLRFLRQAFRLTNLIFWKA